MAKSIRFVIGVLAGAALAMGANAQSSSYSSGSSSSSGNDAISKSAAVYGTYQSAVTDLRSKPFSSSNDIDKALSDLGAQNPDQLAKGWLSYSALVASQNSQFRAAVNEAVSHYGRDRLFLGLKNDYSYARSLKGGSSAIGSALSAMDADARRLRSVGAQVKEQAYTLQSVGWAKSKVGNGGAKADGLIAKSRSGQPANGNIVAAMTNTSANSNFAKAGGSGAPSLWDGVSSAASTIRFPGIGGRGGSYKRVRSGQEETADRIVTLAAYRVAGADRSAERDIYSAMADQGASACITSANLNLAQCVAAAHTYDELPFCIGNHSLTEIGDCVGKVGQ